MTTTELLLFTSMLIVSPLLPSVDQEQQIENIRSLPESTHGHSAQLVKNRLFVFGGYGPESISLDLETGKWSQFPSMKVRKVFFASVIVDGNIYAIGSKSADEDQSVIERFNPATNQWKIVASSSKLPRTHLSAVAVGKNIYVVGGFPSSNTDIAVFNTETGTVSELEPSPGHKQGDHFHYAVNLKGKLHVLGGMRFADDSGPMKQHWMWNGTRWIEKAPMPQPSITKFGVYGVLNDKLYVFSKQDGLHHTYDPETDSWTDTLAEIPINRVMAASVAGNNRLFLLGGRGITDKHDDKKIIVYDAKLNQWQVDANQ